MPNSERPLPDPENAEYSIRSVSGTPIDVWDQINKYGTYEIQDTTDTDNIFPTIGPTGAWRNCLDLPPFTEEKKKTDP